MEVAVYNMKGKETGTMSVDDVALGETVNPVLIKQAYVMYHANLRQGSARTRNRAMLTYSRKKIYRQKGTGRARHGDKKVNIFRGGGHAFNKKRTRADFHKDMPKKMRRKANRNALLAKLIDSEVKVIDGLRFVEPRTKAMIEFLAAIGVDKTALLALSGDYETSANTRLSGRNVEGISMCEANQINAFTMLNHRYLVIDKADLEAWLGGPSSQTGKSARTEPLGAGEKQAKRRRPYKKKPVYVAKATSGGAE